MPDESSQLHPFAREARRQAALGTGHKSWFWILPLTLIVSSFTSLPQIVTRAPAGIVTVVCLGLGIPLGVLAWHQFTAAQRKNREAQAARVGWPTHQPFPVHGFDSWIVCSRPLFDVHFVRPIDHALLERAVRAQLPSVKVTGVAERVARFELPPSSFAYYRHREPIGDFPLLERTFQSIVLPLHHDTGVERVEMGGTLQ